jgi:hypothetical protein
MRVLFPVVFSVFSSLSSHQCVNKFGYGRGCCHHHLHVRGVQLRSERERYKRGEAGHRRMIREDRIGLGVGLGKHKKLLSHSMLYGLPAYYHSRSCFYHLPLIYWGENDRMLMFLKPLLCCLASFLFFLFVFAFHFLTSCLYDIQ